MKIPEELLLFLLKPDGKKTIEPIGRGGMEIPVFIHKTGRLLRQVINGILHKKSRMIGQESGNNTLIFFRLQRAGGID